jgi:hypothetical protein
MQVFTRSINTVELIDQQEKADNNRFDESRFWTAVERGVGGGRQQGKAVIRVDIVLLTYTDEIFNFGSILDRHFR